jgi:hypothetical protein
MYSALQLLKAQLKDAHELFLGTVADIDENHIHKTPGGKALPLGATYAHLVFSEDAILHAMMQGKTPLFESTWKGKTGTSTPMPPMDANWSEANEKWSKEVTINLAQLKEYEKAVFAATDEYVAALQDEDLEKEIDLGDWGKKTIAELLYSFIIGHTYSLAGEISALKGIQGAKGYPF